MILHHLSPRHNFCDGGAPKAPLPGPPAEEAERQPVTLWRRSIGQILIGMVLCSVTLHFWYLSELLPAIGLILLLLGFRALRRENRWFSVCWIIAAVRTALFFSLLALGGSIIQAAGLAEHLLSHLALLNLILLLLQYGCFAGGMKALQFKAGAAVPNGGAAGLFIWALAMVFFSILPLEGTPRILLTLSMAVIFLLIIRTLFQASKKIDETGYEVDPAPVKLQNRALCALILAAFTAALACCYLFLSRYPMRWVVAEPTEPATAPIRENLLALGFPEIVLRDLSAEDLQACNGAVEVFYTMEDFPVNNGRTIREKNGNQTVISRVFDEKELRLTSVAVRLPGEQEHWKIFHHFLWIKNPGFYGTEAMMLQPADLCEGWPSPADADAGGRVLYNEGGTVYTAPYFELGTDAQFPGSLFAAFSMPEKGTRHRGYLSYHVRDMESAVYLYSGFRYTHQKSRLQYPAITAMDHQKSDTWSNHVFHTADEEFTFRRGI